MRAGGFALPHALTPEATAVVKQAVVLAKRRGHAQVTPLHVANTMLSASSGLFRAACQEAHAHPLQCKALELCFNVALNRLPASSSSPILGPHSHHPSISNALVATFKRAQAHQRRGSIESQQQPILAVKIELEQLIISILDDPSVSRVMKEAGFSSTQVKNNVEKAISFSLDLSKDKSKEKQNTLLTQNERKLEQIKNEDVNLVIEALSRKRKSLVIVGESISNLENTVKGLMNMVEKGEVQEDLKELKFVTMRPLYSFCNLQREDVEQEIGELTCLVKSLVGKGVILYLGDFKWISDYRVQERGYYCAVEHVIMELGRLVWGIGEVGRFWLMGIATFETYMRCRNGCYNSLETLWGLHPVTIPANGLGLSLVSDQRNEEIEGRQRINRPEINEVIDLCGDCSVKFEDEAGNMQASKELTLSNLPPWLRGESRRLSNNDQISEGIRDLYNKWNSFCTSAHKQPQVQETLTLRSPEPNQNRTFSPIIMQENTDWQNMFSSNPSSTMNSASSSDIIEIETMQRFKEFNAENLNILCNALEKKVPWQKEIIPDIAGTVLQSRSGMLRRKAKTKVNSSDPKQDTWLLFLGPDIQAKEIVARELARVVFGFRSKFITIGFSSFVSSSDDCHGNKRGRDEESCMSYMEKFGHAVKADPHRVFYLEDLDQVDYLSQMGIKRAIESGRISDGNGEEVGLCDAIVVLSCDGFSFRSRVCSPMKNVGNRADAAGSGGEGETRGCVSLDLNLSFDDENVEDVSVDDLGIFEYVDRRVTFKIQDL
ncbi:Chaperone HSP104 [Handroanthus impetiginosus]|uniref:Chaperone HSP104 n=1 Tax=Handroanthus impetiginosus TaxID=429701 RepID=A0A2G9H5Z9_9LAMI|nr:Chaperone HSP104 [Handroanthus impetiginosus]